MLITPFQRNQKFAGNNEDVLHQAQLSVLQFSKMLAKIALGTGVAISCVVASNCELVHNLEKTPSVPPRRIMAVTVALSRSPHCFQCPG
jgi:hypothetical protein